jgi:hypothetical protein
MTTSAITIQKIALRSSVALAAMLVTATASQAQNIFCPATTTTTTGQTNFALSQGLCTNNTFGAFSTAALSSEVVTEVEQTSTQTATNQSMEGVAKRRTEEAASCAAGFTRVNGECQRVAQTAAPRADSTTTRASPQASITSTRAARRVAHAAPAPVYAPVYKAPVQQIEGSHYGAWINGYGDYERRSQNSTFATPAGVGGIGLLGLGGTPLTVDLTQKTTTWGVVGGVDTTFRNLAGGNDGVVVGLLGGYSTADVRLSGTSTSADPSATGTDVSSGTVRVSGPSIGAYLTYFNGPFSVDNIFRAEFFNVDESFTDNIVFNTNPAGGGTTSITGNGSTRMTNYIVASQFQYRIPMMGGYWVSPLAGYRYTASEYDSSAAALGLANGHSWRVQGGATVGVDMPWNSTLVTLSVTGLAYDDVQVTGGLVTGGATGAFAGGTVLPSDAGKVRGQGIVVANIDYGGGLSAFAQGDVRGGRDLFGIGGRVGVRYAW